MALRPEAIRLGESAHLVVSVEGVDHGPAPEVPAIQGVRIGGPSVEQSVSMSLINGRMQRQRTVNYRYSLVPLQPGDYRIGPVVYTYQNKTVTVPAQTLRVVGDAGQGREAQSIEDMVFAKMTVSKERVFIHESFLLTLALYSRDVNLGRNISLMNMPDSGIQSQPFEELPATREVVRDDVYHVRRYQTRIRPLTAGTLRFEPTLRVQVLVPRQPQRRGSAFDDAFFQGFFSTTEAHPFDLRPDPLDVVVRSLPDTNRPASFTGGVGKFQFHAQVQETVVRPGDPVTLTLRIEGEGNLDSAGVPAVAESERFRVYPPRTTHSDIDATGYRGWKHFEQVVIPRTPESSEIPPLEFSFFNPDTGRYQTITRGPLKLNLQAADEMAQRMVRADDAAADRSARIVGEDIRYLKAAPVRWNHTGGIPWFATRTFWGAQIVPLMAGLVIMLLGRHRGKLNADAALARRYRAPRRARRGLHRAQTAAKHNDVDGFYNALWTALSGYFGDRLNLASGDITAGNLIAAMRRQGLDETNLKRLERIVAACEQYRFGRVVAPPAAMHALPVECKQLFKACERLSS